MDLLRRTFLKTAATTGAATALGLAGRAHAQTDMAAGLVAGTQAEVTTEGLRVRGGPAVDEPIVATLASGSGVDLLGRSADGVWWRVAADTTVGYVDGAYLQPTGAATTSGVLDVDLPVSYTPQLSPVWCDPADLQMWLAYHAVLPGGGSARLQKALWDWETGHNAGFTVDQWDCSPFAVASAAHHWLPSLGFDHFVYDDPLAATRLLAWLLVNPAYREPSIALIWRGAHYVLVRGVRALGDPYRDGKAARLLGVYVADPNKGEPSWLGQDRFVPIDRWLAELFTPATYRTPHTGVPGDPWQDAYVAVQRGSTADGPSADGQRNATPGSYT